MACVAASRPPAPARQRAEGGGWSVGSGRVEGGGWKVQGLKAQGVSSVQRAWGRGFRLVPSLEGAGSGGRGVWCVVLGWTPAMQMTELPARWKRKQQPCPCTPCTREVTNRDSKVYCLPQVHSPSGEGVDLIHCAALSLLST
jgi:hypothetical protein